jgi:glycerophosphoryl diester phosphodiesterase
MLVPELIAHRGWAKNFPENTLSAVEAAIGAGAGHVEIDVQLSRDAFPVLFHDRTLERMCGVPGAVHERTRAELSELSAAERGKFGDAFAGEGIASLAGFAELLLRHPHVHAFVEIKRVALEQFGELRVLERVLAALEPALAQCALISYSTKFLATVRGRHAIPLGAVFDRWEQRTQPAIADLSPEFLFCDLDGLPAAGPLDRGPAHLAVFEVADPRLALELAARGADMVETFAIGEMERALAPLRARRRVDA